MKVMCSEVEARINLVCKTPKITGLSRFWEVFLVLLLESITILSLYLYYEKDV